MSGDSKGDQVVNDETKDVDGRIKRKRKKNHAGAWIGGIVGTVCLFFAIYVGTADRRDARAHISQYQSMVSKCSNDIDKGSSDYSVLFDAIEQIETLEKWENQYSQYYPDVFNQSTSLNNRLKQKRVEASEAWAKSAKSQKRLGEYSKAIEYYRLANKLSASSSYNSEIESIAKTMGYMKVRDIEFRNYDDNKEISAYGEPIKATDARWLGARVKYDGLIETTKTIDIKIKIYEPDGTLWGKHASEGYTWCDDKCDIHSGENNILYLDGYGNATSSCYRSGTYRYEIWYNGNKLFSKKLQFQ